VRGVADRVQEAVKAWYWNLEVAVMIGNRRELLIWTA